MTPLEEQSRKELVARWIHKADIDVQAAEELLSSQRGLLYPACFHCQQAPEKYLKAFLTWRQVEFPKTHSIRVLLNLVKPANPQLAEQLIEAAALTVYGVEARYPGDLPEPSAAEATAAVDLATKVRDAVMRALPNN